ncbi:MAG: hypothetical protein KBB29_05405, partial [Bacteroidales bacterium]|nr:hypothetical protein [Bacteroidales bacterium]
CLFGTCTRQQKAGVWLIQQLFLAMPAKIDVNTYRECKRVVIPATVTREAIMGVPYAQPRCLKGTG